MTKKLNRLLFFWLPILALYLYAFDAVLQIDIARKFFNYLPLWGWLAGYLAITVLAKIHLKSFTDGEEQTDDYAARTIKVNSDIILVFLFSIISFVLIMLLLGNSLNSAMNLLSQ